VNRGKRRKAHGEGLSRVEEFDEAALSAAKRAWARRIKQMAEVNLLLCARCGGPRRIIAVIEPPAILEKLLARLGLWPAPAPSPPAGVPGALLAEPGCRAIPGPWQR
jgi:hypothetical protein